MEVLDGLDSPEAAGPYVSGLVAKGERVMGFGHRVYKTYDPRAVIYKEMVRKVAKRSKGRPWFAIAEAIEMAVQTQLRERQGKPLYPNVDFYSGVLYKYLDLDSELATSMFAVSRVAGWTAHVMEQYEDNRLIRPRAKTTGRTKG
jgi:citrate synthase